MLYLQRRRLQCEIEGKFLESVSPSAHAIDGAGNNQHADQYEYERPNVGRDVHVQKLSNPQDDYEEPDYYADYYSAIGQTEAPFFGSARSKAVVASLHPFNVKR